MKSKTTTTLTNASSEKPAEIGKSNPQAAGATVVYTLGPKGGIGKSLTSRLIIDGLIAANRNVRIVQVDRAPTLPFLYPGNVITIEAPGAEEMRSDSLAAMRVFEPLEATVQAIAKSDAAAVIDIGAGQNQRAFLNFVARGRFDRFLTSVDVRAIALILMTSDPSAMEQSANLVDELRLVHPSAEIVPIFNLRDGRFKFFPGAPAHKTYTDRIVPLMKGRRHVTLPAIATGAWPFFEAAGMSFTEAAMADEATLVEKLGMSRLMVTALQGDVAEFLSVVWPRLGAIAGFAVEGFDAGH
jgi:hypothetical protein